MINKLRDMFEDLNKKNQELVDKHTAKLEERKKIDSELAELEKESIFIQGQMSSINDLGTYLFEQEQTETEAAAPEVVETVPAEQVIVES